MVHWVHDSTKAMQDNRLGMKELRSRVHSGYTQGT
jgi:hypothetical protein